MRKFYSSGWALMCPQVLMILSLIILSAPLLNLLAVQNINSPAAFSFSIYESNIMHCEGVSYFKPINVLRGSNGLQPNICLNSLSKDHNDFIGWKWDLPEYSPVTKVGKRSYCDPIAENVSYSNSYNDFLLNWKRFYSIKIINGTLWTLYIAQNEDYGKIVSFSNSNATILGLPRKDCNDS